MTETGQAAAGALAGLRVLDLANESGAYCGKLLADLGADVIRIEPPTGAPERALGPFAEDVPDPERSLWWWHYQTSKRGITLALDTADGQALFRRLARSADVVLETFPPGTLDGWGLGYAQLSALNPGLVLTSITPFGLTGPHSGYRTSDLVGLSMGGMVSVCGDSDREPVRPPGGQAYHTASNQAAIATLVALYHRDLTGEGQHVDVSVQEAVATILEHTSIFWIYNQYVAPRQGNRHGLRGPGPVGDIYPAADGYVCLAYPEPHQATALLQWLAETLPADPRIAGVTDLPLSGRTAEQELEMFGAISAHTRQYTMAELFEESQRRRIPCGMVNNPSDLLDNPQLAARDWFAPVEQPELGRTIRYPGTPYGFRGTPWRLSRRAPHLGEHNQEIYRDELGLSAAELSLLKTAGAI